MKTLLGTEARPCSKHGDAHLGVITGLCMACEDELTHRLVQLTIDELVARSKNTDRTQEAS